MSGARRSASSIRKGAPERQPAADILFERDHPEELRRFVHARDQAAMVRGLLKREARRTAIPASGV